MNFNGERGGGLDTCIDADCELLFMSIMHYGWPMSRRTTNKKERRTAIEEPILGRCWALRAGKFLAGRKKKNGWDNFEWCLQCNRENWCHLVSQFLSVFGFSLVKSRGGEAVIVKGPRTIQQPALFSYARPPRIPPYPSPLWLLLFAQQTIKSSIFLLRSNFWINLFFLNN